MSQTIFVMGDVAITSAKTGTSRSMRDIPASAL